MMRQWGGDRAGSGGGVTAGPGMGRRTGDGDNNDEEKAGY